MPPSNPNFGTGYVDWSSYVNANQPNIQADRSKVQNYLQGEDTQTRNAATNAFGQTGYENMGAQGSQGGMDWSTLQNDLNTNQAALQDSGGFQQVLAKANAAYNPLGKDAKGNAQAAPQAAYDPFSAALEGQNAGALYSGAGDAQKFAEGITGTHTKGKAPAQTPPQNEPSNPYNGNPTVESGTNYNPEGPADKPRWTPRKNRGQP